MTTYISTPRESNAFTLCIISCYKGLPLFEETDSYESVYKWFRFLMAEGNLITGYIILPHQVQVILYHAHCHVPLTTLVGEGKRFMAYDIVRGLQSRGRAETLAVLSAGVQPKERRKGKRHQVFRPSFRRCACPTEEIIAKKLHKLQQLPVHKKLRLTDESLKWPHSSEAFYELGREGYTRIYHYKDLLDDWKSRTHDVLSIADAIKTGVPGLVAY